MIKANCIVTLICGYGGVWDIFKDVSSGDALYIFGSGGNHLNAWNSYLGPLIIIQKDDSKTMPPLISNLIAGYVTDYGALMLAVTISILPTAIIF